MRIFTLLISSIFFVVTVQAQGIITHIAGNSVTQFIGDGWPATNYSLAAPSGVCVDKTGNVFICDYADSRIRRVTPNDTLSTVGDTSGIPGYSGDGGLAVNAKFKNPAGICMDTTGNFYISEEFNNTVRKINKTTKIVTTVCGSGAAGFSGDGGPATAATFNQAAGLCVDRAGNIYIVDKGNSRVRKVTFATGIISTVAGTTSSGYSGDNGPATDAKLNFPRGVTADTAGNIFIADYGNNRIRRVDAVTGIITTYAGTGTAGYSGNGAAATAAQLRSPNNVFMDKHGGLYISDNGNNVVRRVSPDGTINTIAGTGANGFSGDGGPATAAAFWGPSAIFVDNNDNIFITDYGNSVVWKITGFVTGIHNINTFPVVRIYPNPSNGILFISADTHDPMDVMIFNTVGQNVLEMQMKSGKEMIDMSSYPAGFYYVTARSATGSETKKVLITK